MTWTKRLLAIVLLGGTTLAWAGRRHVVDRDLPVRTEETIQKTFTVSPSGTAVLDLDNVHGSIDVVGTQGSRIEVTIAKTTRAESQAELERARMEVTLDITQDGDSVRLYANGPFRCNDSCMDCWRTRRESRYVVTYDFTVRVPERIALKLKTVDGDHVTVDNVLGDYEVGNVNGEITMRNVGGSGKVKTINGPVRVTFRENPREDSEFSTINGDVELVFANRLAADFRFKTFQGEIYSDFTLTALPPSGGVAERKNGRFVYHSDRYTGGRVGSGGPEIKLENLNGDLRVLGRES